MIEPQREKENFLAPGKLGLTETRAGTAGQGSNTMEAGRPALGWPRKRTFTAAQMKLVFLCFCLAGVAFGYFFVWTPLQDGLRTGEIRYSFKAVLFAPMMIYMGLLGMVVDLRDGRMKVLDAAGKLILNAKGKPQMTRFGKMFVAGAVVVMLLAVAAWELTLRHYGFRSA